MAHLWVLGFWNWIIKDIWVSFFVFFQMPNHDICFDTYAFVNLVHFICDL
jgi:hypothetical protein